MDNNSLPLGAEEAAPSNRIYVNLRIGQIAQTSNKPLPGFYPAHTTNKDGTVNNFFAKRYNKITGHIDHLQFRTRTLPDGTSLSGWNVYINDGKNVFVLEVGANSRPYQRFMNCMLNVDFSRTVMFVGFNGKDKNDRPQKVLLLSQSIDPETKKPVWIKPVFEERWLTRAVAIKLRDGIELTEDERRRVEFDETGNPKRDYPYIREKNDGKWSMDVWTEFLFDQMESHVLPLCKAAADERGTQMNDADADLPTDGDDIPEYSGGPAAQDDDDIPF